MYCGSFEPRGEDGGGSEDGGGGAPSSGEVRRPTVLRNLQVPRLTHLSMGLSPRSAGGISGRMGPAEQSPSGRTGVSCTGGGPLEVSS